VNLPVYMLLVKNNFYSNKVFIGLMAKAYPTLVGTFRYTLKLSAYGGVSCFKE